ncbi:helix-turn-helix domain-containing protein [Geovibrio thiophilus]|nr:helix-turn-helix domain-containing protein [Geovibrio thiophilus]
MIGKRLRQLLALHNMTQAELCRKLGISPGNMSNFINDQRNPSLETLSRIAGYFSVNIDSFVSETPYVHSGPKLLSSVKESNLISSGRLWIKIDTNAFSPAFREQTLIFVDRAASVHHRDCVLIYRNGKPEIYRYLVKSRGSILIPFRKTEMPLEINKQSKEKLYKITFSASAP